MINFVTRLPLKPLTCQQFHQLLTQHHELKDLSDKALVSDSNGWIINKGNVVAYHFEEDGIQEYIYSEDHHELYLSIDNDKQYKLSKFIDRLIHEGYLENDGDLSILDTPQLLNNQQSIHTKYLPFIYFDKNLAKPLIMNELVNRLKGMVHILYGNNHSDHEIKKYYNIESNCFACLFNGDFFRLSKLKNETDEDFVDRICFKMQSYLAKRVFEYPFRMNELYQEALSELIEKSKDNEETMLKNYDLEISRLENRKQNILNRIEYLNQQMNKLNAQISYYEMMLESKQAFPILFKGEEKDLYEAEQKDMILYLVEKELETERDPERIALIKDILKENPKQGTRDNLIEEMESILGKSQFMTASMRSQLRKLGIDFERTKNHPNGAFFDDERYPLVFSSSPSDIHANDQNRRFIKKHCF